MLAADAEQVRREAAHGTRASASDLQQIYRQHAPYVWRCLRRLGLSEADAEDALQDVFVVAARRLPEFGGRAAITTWLFRIALNVVRGTRRRRQRKVPETTPTPLALQVQAQEASLTHRHAMEQLDRLLDELDDDQRAVFVLVEVEGVAGPEAAEALGWPLNTVYSRLRRARRRVREHADRVLRGVE